MNDFRGIRVTRENEPNSLSDVAGLLAILACGWPFSRRVLGPL